MVKIRRSKIDQAKIREILEMRLNGIKMVCIAYDLNISISTVHKYLKIYGDDRIAETSHYRKWKAIFPLYYHT